jgi:amidase
MAQVKVVKRKRPWQDIAQEAQRYRDASIARVWPDLPQLPENLAKNVTEIPGTILSQEEVQITEMPPEGLLSALASGDLTAVAVTTAFLRRAGLAQKLVCSERVVESFLSLC